MKPLNDRDAFALQDAIRNRRYDEPFRRVADKALADYLAERETFRYAAEIDRKSPK